MGGRAPKGKKASQGHRRARGKADPHPGAAAAGRKPAEKEPGINPGNLISGVLKFFPGIVEWLAGLEDFRDESRIIYSLGLLVFMGMLSRLMGLTSNRATDAYNQDVGMGDKKLPEEWSNLLAALNRLSGDQAETLPHSDTVKYLMENLDPRQLPKLRDLMVGRLLRSRTLECMRVDGMYLVAIDGVTYCTSHRRLEHSTHKTHGDGTVEYMLTALEAKLVSPSGLVFSMLTESIENPDGEYDKQDCELKACQRLLEELHQKYPRLRICLLLDGLYLSRSIIDICLKYHWDYSITFKPGSAPVFHQEAQRRLAQERHNRLEGDDPADGRSRRVAWCNQLIYNLGDGGTPLAASVVRMEKSGQKGGPEVFMYLTSLRLSHKNVLRILDQVCRTRWKIENQGFNNQKNHGLGLELAFGTNGNAGFNYYMIVQLAHILLELITKTSLFRRLQQLAHPKQIPRVIRRPMLEWFGTVRHLQECIRNALLYRTLDDIDFSGWRLALDSA